MTLTLDDEIVMEDFKSFEVPKVFEEVVDISFKEIVEREQDYQLTVTTVMK